MKSNGQVSVCLNDLTASPSLLDNFLTDPSHSLRKRNGYKKLFDLSFAPNHAYISGSSPEDSVNLVLENYVSTIDLKHLCEIPPYDTPKPVSNSSSSVVRYGDETVIFDGACVCQRYGDGTRELSGYVPLCANMWECGKKGEIFEALNLLSNHFRATYRFTGESTTLFLPFYARCIDRVSFNGNVIAPEDYDLSLDGEKIYCRFLDGEEGENFITVYATVSDGFAADSAIARCRSASCDNSTLYVFGSSQEGDETKLFFSSPSHEKSDVTCISLYGVNSELCFFEGDQLIMSSGKEIRAVFPIYDKVLIFCENDVHLLEAGELPTLLFSGAGALCNQSVARFGKDVIFVGKSGLFRLTLADKKESCKLSRLLSPSLFPKDFLSGACLVCDSDSELVYVYNSHSDEGAFVYSFEAAALSHFTGLSPHVMFCFDGKTYFTTDDKLFVFSDDSYSDSPDGESSVPITALFRSKAFDIDSPFTRKKLESLSLRALGQGEASVSLELDKAKRTDVSLKLRPHVPSGVFKRKLPPHRFYSVSVTVSHTGDGELCIPALELIARGQKSK